MKDPLKTIKGTHRLRKGEAEPIKAKPFPGPWSYDGNQEVTTSPKKGSWRLICTIPAMAGNTDFANARLIAAAPNLFDACKALLMAYADGAQRGGDMEWDDVDQAYQAALAAMAKATGQTEEELALQQPERFDTSGE